LEEIFKNKAMDKYEIIKKTLILILSFFIITDSITAAMAEKITAPAEEAKQRIEHPHSLGSSLFLLGNIGDSVNFAQLNYGYRLSKKVNLIAEIMTWTYYEPLGTYGNSEEYYPGKVRAQGLGLGYQRFLWKNLYTTIEPIFFLQQFYDAGNSKIQNGFQLYLQFITGYRIEFFRKRMFVEPAIALKYWPVNTNFPDSFAAIEKGAPKYKFEPGLNFGFTF
jgi:hypothetical protein